jgi:hypothetical protein
MVLKALDEHHFYIDEKLVDLVWIGYQAKKQINAANYHDINRHLNWLSKLAERLVVHDVDERDERVVKKRLVALGLGWYLD